MLICLTHEAEMEGMHMPQLDRTRPNPCQERQEEGNKERKQRNDEQQVESVSVAVKYAHTNEGLSIKAFRCLRGSTACERFCAEEHLHRPSGMRHDGETKSTFKLIKLTEAGLGRWKEKSSWPKGQ
jgi:hypothetical protein